jgi:hypothetical protein
MLEGAPRSTDTHQTLSRCAATFACGIARPATLALLPIFVAKNRAVAGILVRGGFFLARLLLQFTRVADIRRSRRHTEEVNPATHFHLHRYAVAFAAVSATPWATRRLVLTASRLR